MGLEALVWSLSAGDDTPWVLLGWPLVSGCSFRRMMMTNDGHDDDDDDDDDDNEEGYPELTGEQLV